MNIWRLWGLVRTQVRTSFGGIVGLDYGVVPAIASLYGIEFSSYEMDGLRILEQDMLMEQMEREEKDKDNA